MTRGKESEPWPSTEVDLSENLALENSEEEEDFTIEEDVIVEANLITL